MERADFKPGVWFTLRNGSSAHKWKVIKELGNNILLLEAHRKDNRGKSITCEWKITKPSNFVIINEQVPETNSVTGFDAIEEEKAFKKKRDDIFRTLFE